jgi:4-methylaminobutanoate oxidase (formaldehyde-forming)
MTAPEHLANRDLDVAGTLPASELPAHARVAIVGGGIIGACIAYHLAAAGETDVVLVERGRLTNGTTWHAAGLVSQARGTHALTALAVDNAAAYDRVAAESGIDVGLRRHGSISLARTPARMDELVHGVGIARDFGIEVEIVGPGRVRDLWPGMAADDLVGGTYFPNDGTVNPGFAALAFAKAAVDRGVRYVPGTTVTGFCRGADGRSVTGVISSRGEVTADTVVLASGLWTSELARLAGADVALFPAEHVWVMTDETDLASETKPFVRDLDGFLYARHYRGRLVIGAFEPDGRPLPPARVPVIGFVELGPDWDHLAPVLAQARRRFPGIESLGFEHFLRAPESFTPDGNLQLGLVPEVPGLFVAAGLNSQGIIFGPGVGRAAAEWILAGHPTMDLVEVDVARTGSWATQRRWLEERTVESLGSLYDMHWPAKQPTTARGLRRLPLHAEHRAAGAAFGQAAAWERPLWFEPGVLEPAIGYDYAAPSWFDAVRAEVGATRTGVALYDLTTYSKFLVQGPGSVAGLQRLATSDLDVDVGRIVYTVLANERGGIEMDPTITRLDASSYLVLAPTLSQRRTLALLRNGLPADAVVTDVTSAYATLHLAGPRSREVLSRLTDADLSTAAWPFLRAEPIEVGRASGWAFRVSYTGELGWELLVPTEFAADLYAQVMAAGADVGLRPAGAFAFEAARLERGFRAWGHDMGPLDDPFAAGLGFTLSRRKRVDFVGRDALERIREAGAPDRRLVSVHAPDAVLWHGESVLRGEARVGHVTSASIAPSLGGSAGLAWVHGSLDGDWRVEVRGELVTCAVSERPFVDPDGERLRG